MPFRIDEVNVRVEKMGPDIDLQPLVDEVSERVKHMAGSPVKLVNRRKLAADELSPGIVLREWRDMRIEFPQFAPGRANVGDEFSGIGAMQVPHGGGEPENIAHRLVISENQFPRRHRLDLRSRAGLICLLKGVCGFCRGMADRPRIQPVGDFLAPGKSL